MTCGLSLPVSRKVPPHSSTIASPMRRRNTAARGGGGLVVIRRKVGVRWYFLETGSERPEVIDTQVDKIAVIGPEASQQLCCKKGWPSLPVRVSCRCLALLSGFVARIRPI
ncbi:hypothetical protein E2C01_057191 [Portunus trituberculatus]|uniref:Uncharacterized protein n=1 Tax=Portunus trituberculatus TaxID=210409 RepID=A0A5B7H163_PORTR|nr:hypothetical protein [Portunus trituberculatus]